MTKRRPPVVLDAWPIMRYREGRPAVKAEVDELLSDGGLTLICSINLGEVHCDDTHRRDRGH